MRQAKPSENISSCANSKSDEGLEVEMDHNAVQLIGQLVHGRINITEKSSRITQLNYIKTTNNTHNAQFAEKFRSFRQYNSVLYITSQTQTSAINK